MQLEHNQIQNFSHTKDIRLILDHVENQENIGLIIRTAEAMGVKQIFIISKKWKELTPKIKRMTRSTEKSVNITFIEEWDNELIKDCTVYALEKTSESVNYTDFQFEYPCAIVCGNEKHGVSPGLLNKSQSHLHIPMYGNNSSMNVAIATAIVLAKAVE